MTGTFHWTTQSGGEAQTVQWCLQGRAYADGDAIDQAWGTMQTVSDAWLADNDVHITAATPAITLAGTPAASQKVQIRAYRDVANDDLAGDAMLTDIVVVFGRT
ncbi:MAG TPA: hypothetical protein VMX14_03730 [Anaerolineae bacterium]|nr:hypothetical protein [Anaerolineae bacterium]